MATTDQLTSSTSTTPPTTTITHISARKPGENDLQNCVILDVTMLVPATMTDEAVRSSIVSAAERLNSMYWSQSITITRPEQPDSGVTVYFQMYLDGRTNTAAPAVQQRISENILNGFGVPLPKEVAPAH